MQDISKSIEACAAYYGDDAAAVREYLIEGQKRALALPNRGPLRFMDNGEIHSDILEAYSTYGFYIFENALRQEELKDLESDLEAMRDNFPLKWARLPMQRVGQPWGRIPRVLHCNGQNLFLTLLAAQLWPMGDTK